MELDGKKLSWIIIAIGAGVITAGLIIIGANQDVAYNPTGGDDKPIQYDASMPIVGLKAFRENMGAIYTAAENVGRASARDRGVKMIIWGILIAGGGAILRACIKEPRSGNGTDNKT